MKPPNATRLRPVPLTLAQANALVSALHRHHKPAVGHRFTIGCETTDGRIVGAGIVGRPVARMTEQYRVAEVTRCVTDGTPNAPSMLYSATARAAQAMGYDLIQTFILASEPGTSLLAAGWTPDPDESRGGAWDRVSRPNRRQDQPRGRKRRWYKALR